MKSHKGLLYLFSFIALSMLACGGDSSGGEGEWATYTSNDLGISFELPVSWATEEEVDNITYANNSRVLNAEVINDGGGGYVSVEPVADYGGMDDPAALLDLLVIDFTSDGALSVVEPLTPVDLNGQPAASVKMEGILDGQEGTFLVTVIIANEQLALILSIDGTEDGEYVDFLSRIAESMVIQ